MRTLTIAVTSLASLWLLGSGCAPGQLVLNRAEGATLAATDATAWRNISRSGEVRARGWNGPFDVRVEENAEAGGDEGGNTTYSTWAAEGLDGDRIEAWMLTPAGQRSQVPATAIEVADGQLHLTLPPHPAGTRLTIRYGLHWEGALDGLRWSFQGPEPLARSELTAVLPDQAPIRVKIQRAPGSLMPDYTRREMTGSGGEALIEHSWSMQETQPASPGWSTAVMLWSASPIPSMPARFQLRDGPIGPKLDAKKMAPVRPVDTRRTPRAIEPRAIRPKAR